MRTIGDPQLDNAQRGRGFEALSLEWEVFKASQSSAVHVEQEAGRREEPEVKDDSEEPASSRHNRTDAHVISDTVAAHT